MTRPTHLTCHDEQRDAVAARTALHGQHGGVLAFGSSSTQVSYVDDDGEPVLVLPLESAAFELAVSGRSVSLRVDGDDMVVLLHGRLALVVLDGSAAHEVDLHGRCLSDQGVDWAACPAYARMSVSGIWAAQPARAGAPGRWAALDLRDYVEAQPDTWALHSAALLTHINTDHAADLLSLVRRADPTIAVDARTWLIAATAADRTGIDVSLVGPDGAYRTRVAYDRPVERVDEVMGALYRQLTRASTDPA